MATAETLFDDDHAQSESIADRGLTFAAMLGAVLGAVAGAVLEMELELGNASPLLLGTAGAMLGGALVAGAWWATVRAATALLTGELARRERAPVGLATPVAGAR